MARLFFLLGSLLAGSAVAMGAWGAHSDVFEEVQSLWIDKGVRYQMYHGLALLCTSLLIASRKSARLAVVAGGCFLGGVVLFCGSLYFMALSSVDAGYITPAGGMLFILGWICLAFSAPGRK